jgi:hypothetical protein
MNNRANDLSARLLATENLSVVRAVTRTASFDIKSRVLTLPMWKDMTPEIEDMLIGHEVGHALYTGEEYIEPIRENPKMQSYMNIIEDVRIEKMMKRKYPGLRKHMNEGYKQLNERDFFGVKSIQNFDDMLLIDRINLYYKVGFQCGVTFTPEEKLFVNRAERCETVQDVIDLAKEIYAYSKEQAEKRKQERLAAGEPADDEDDEDPITGDFDFDSDDFREEADEDSELNPNNNGKSNKESDAPQPEGDEDIEAKTDRAFQQNLEDLADSSTEYHYWKFSEDFAFDPVVSYKKILNETKSAADWTTDDMRQIDYNVRYMTDEQRAQHYAKMAGEYENFKTESQRTVNYLVKEFEMKKSAQIYKRVQISKSGSLDMRKIYAYKLQDDLFKRVATIPKGKNHGMMMLVDWSGSMDHVLNDTMKQVINLVMFCQRVQIPFRVFAFTTQYQRDSSYEEREELYRIRKEYQQRMAQRQGLYLSNSSPEFNLLELFSDKMTTSEFHAMAKRVIDYRFRWNAGYSTGGTPLNEALAWCYLNLGDFIKKHNLEKSTFITLTDGEGGQLVNAADMRRLDNVRVSYDNGYERIKQRHFIRDEKTQKTYELTSDATTQTDTIIRMIKDRFGIRTVGFYICRNHRQDLRSAIKANIPNYTSNTDVLVDAWRKCFRDQNFASVKNTARDELFIVPASSTKIEEGELEVKADAKAASIAKNFGKYLNVKKTSRVLLNRFVDLVA